MISTKKVFLLLFALVFSVMLVSNADAVTYDLKYYSVGPGTGGAINESESDGVMGSSFSSVGAGDAADDDTFYTEFFIKTAPTADISLLTVAFRDINGNPENGNFIYDIFICPTALPSLNSGVLEFVNCNDTATLVLDEYNVSANFGVIANSWVNLTFDASYSMDSGTNYIVIFNQSSSDSANSVSDFYEWDLDTFPPSNRYVHRRDSGGSSATTSSMGGIKLWQAQLAEPPQYDNVGVNTTIYSSPALFYSHWTDDINLSGYIFSTNNTGTWINESWESMTGTEDWSNITDIINGSAGVPIGWIIYANDSLDQWNSTGYESFVTSAMACLTRIDYPELLKTYTYSINLPLELEYDSAVCTNVVYGYFWSGDSGSYPYGNYSLVDQFDVDYNGNYTLYAFAYNSENSAWEYLEVDFYVDRTMFDAVNIVMVIGLSALLIAIAMFVFKIGTDMPEKHAPMKIFFVFIPIIMVISALHILLLSFREYFKVPSLNETLEVFNNVYFWAILFAFMAYFFIYMTVKALQMFRDRRENDYD